MGEIILGALIGGVVTLMGAAINAELTEKSIDASVEQSNKNIEMQKEFNKSQTLSAKIAEAKANGISPLAVLGQNASNAVVSAPQASADYSGFANFGSSLQSSLSSLSNQLISGSTAKRVQSMRNENAEKINSMQITSSEKMKLQELNNSLTIANDKNATDKDIQENIRKAQHNLEILRSSNAEFVQKQALQNAMNMLDKQLADAAKERDNRMKVQLVHEAFTTFNTMIYSASSMFGGNVSSYIDNLGRSRIGF